MWLWRPSARLAVGVVLIIGLVGGAGGIVVFNMALANTNTTAFCTRCHEMGTALNELQKTKHYLNRVGVRAECPDCHVPEGGLPKYLAKLAAAKDVWGRITGVIDTPEKYEALRLEMAKGVWAKMKATDSRECRSCHDFNAMKFDDQDKTAAKKHQRIMKEKGDERKTCIDCHQGIAHTLPSGVEE
ncbi:MAG: trimethylamine-N-oxide reductase (cytochrome c) 1 cytochrome c-type subunit TorC [Rhodospirillaceae bacterium]|nr:MAG: trimethylamine-N-oxide reductase (cytochrome c) 1 cytochrome c-type subunit TorC [Rhodospirillaceae bacterium]